MSDNNIISIGFSIPQDFFDVLCDDLGLQNPADLLTEAFTVLEWVRTEIKQRRCVVSCMSGTGEDPARLITKAICFLSGDKKITPESNLCPAWAKANHIDIVNPYKFKFQMNKEYIDGLAKDFGTDFIQTTQEAFTILAWMRYEGLRGRVLVSCDQDGNNTERYASDAANRLIKNFFARKDVRDEATKSLDAIIESIKRWRGRDSKSTTLLKFLHILSLANPPHVGGFCFLVHAKVAKDTPRNAKGLIPSRPLRETLRSLRELFSGLPRPPACAGVLAMTCAPPIVITRTRRVMTDNF